MQFPCATMRVAMTERRRIGIFGWGLVAPKSPNVDVFEHNLESAESWLSPFRGYGLSNFLVGVPEFDFETYHEWFDARFPPAKFAQLKDKMGPMAQYAIGAFIQSLGQNPGIEQYLQSLGTQAHVYVGTGVGDLGVHHNASMQYERAQRRWNEFWAAPERCAALRAHVDGNAEPAAPRDPEEFPIGSGGGAARGDRGPRSRGSAKLTSTRQKLNKTRALTRKGACPDEPWAAVSPNL